MSEIGDFDVVSNNFARFMLVSFSNASSIKSLFALPLSVANFLITDGGSRCIIPTTLYLEFIFE